MAARTKTGEEGRERVTAATTSPWVQRLAEDDELRDNVRVAFEAAKDAFERITDGKSPREAVGRQEVAARTSSRPPTPSRTPAARSRRARRSKEEARPRAQAARARRSAAAIALALSEDLRTKVLDALFGEEEEFDYRRPPRRASAPATGTAA